MLKERHVKKRLVYCDLPYIIGKDYERLCRLMRLYRFQCKKRGFFSNKQYDMLQKQCVSLYRRIYKRDCYLNVFGAIIEPNYYP